jgi:hypothetical protein
MKLDIDTFQPLMRRNLLYSSAAHGTLAIIAMIDKKNVAEVVNRTLESMVEE